jgi:hypothetical protein
MSDLPRIVRPYGAADEAFVFHSWLVSLWETSTMLHWLEKKRVLRHWHSQLERLVSRQSVRIACSPERESLILGWVCSEGEMLHYAYVKELYREQGVCRDLLAAVGHPWRCTAWTPCADRLVTHYPKLRYQPWRLTRRLKDEANQTDKGGSATGRLSVRQAGCDDRHERSGLERFELLVTR